MKKLLLLVKLGLILPGLLLAFQLKAQSTVNGKVVSQEDGMGLPGVSVLIKGSTKGTVTDIDGMFKVSANPEDVLVFSFIGYHSQEHAVGTRSQIDISLEADVEQLEEVVVVGYGTQKKSDVTGAVATMSQDRLEMVPNTNVAQALQGSVAGVSIVSNSAGAEGSDAEIMIRGRNTISASNRPLIVLDGMPYSGSLSEINPTDIASVNILKDASSTAIYGSRGANGVILITSKKGAKGAARISYAGFYGIQQMTNVPDLLTSEEFYKFKKTRNPASITASEEDFYQDGKTTDWIDVATQIGHKQQHTLTVSGGSDNVKYYVSGSYLDVEGIAINDLFKRYSMRLNLEAKITDWLTFGSNTQLSLSDRSGQDASWSGAQDGAYYMNPLTEPYDEDGNQKIYPWAESIYWGNPLSGLLEADSDKNYKIFTNNYLQIDLPFVPGLSYKLNTGIEYDHRDRKNYAGRDTKAGYENRGVSDTRTDLDTNILIENILNYKKSIGSHNLFLTALYSYQNDIEDMEGLDSNGFPNDKLTTYQGNVAALIDPKYAYQEFVLLSTMLRFNYNYDNKYYLTLTGRRDSYSAFGANTKHGIFPSVALGWSLHNESFMSAIPTISTLKLRASYGINGNQAVDPYSALSRMSDRSYLNGSIQAAGYYPSALESPDLGWEQSASVNIGLDFGVFKDRVQGSLELYQTNTTDLLLEREIPSTSGFTMTDQNLAEVKNSGVELTLSANLVRTGDFSWDISANAAYMKNEIVDLYGDGVDDPLNGWFIGEAISTNYSYQFDGVYQEEDFADPDFVPAIPGAQPGWAKVVDQNNDTLITSDHDRVFIGQTDPKFITGLQMNFKYKNFGLSLFARSAHGMTRRNTLLNDDVWSSVERNTTNKNWWTPENPTNEYWANHEDANARGVGIYEDASFWRLQNVTFSYDLPKTLLDRVRINNARLYVTGSNLITVTNFGGLDPELSSAREIPLQREFVLGLNIGL
ncbi:TonB-dependent receptor [Reichenbachiella carrageenanivorans]|uniref:TonB-dependent receptor n=1 Tax=Reichenbachiella carrageenanivorans TaxID=2979869 RepID=A0ABY6CXX2_9BACT|nr:TonB-dependent receptor [Reichenbachiella carrageenanivorans]UXX77698.1 TonB-dependent receptor [Reichenbachiella carrageenanivorans]